MSLGLLFSGHICLLCRNIFPFMFCFFQSRSQKANPKKRSHIPAKSRPEGRGLGGQIGTEDQRRGVGCVEAAEDPRDRPWRRHGPEGICLEPRVIKPTYFQGSRVQGCVAPPPPLSGHSSSCDPKNWEGILDKPRTQI